MNIVASQNKLSGTVTVPGSKSHTIRALLLAAMADGISYIENPLPSADCLSAAFAITAFGAKVDIGCPFDSNGKPFGTPKNVWIVEGAGKNIHLPDREIDVGNSGSTLYFFTPVAACFAGTSKFTGDASICTRPVNHLLDALRQLGAKAETTRVGIDAPPFSVTGPIKAGRVTTDGRLSQYISGLMMASALVDGTLDINLTDPKEVPYLEMTKIWLNSVGIPVEMSSDYTKIKVTGPHAIKAFSRVVPADWEAVAFPLIAALLSESDISITGVDCSGSQGDDAIVPLLQSVGADIKIIPDIGQTTGTLVVKGSNSKKLAITTPDKTLRVNISGFPDAVCALAVIGCFIEGTLILEDTGVCRKKETDRIKVMVSELRKCGAELVDGLTLNSSDSLYGDCLIINGKNSRNSMHGATVESYDDHRVAMSLACLGLGLKTFGVADGLSQVGENEKMIVKNAECCSVSFPKFFEVMNGIGAGFVE